MIKDRLDEVDRSGGLAVLVEAEAAAGPPLDAPANDASAGTAAPRRRGKRPSKEPVLFEETRKAREQAEAREVTAVVSDEAGPDDLASVESGVSLTRAELARAADLTDERARPARGIRPRRARRAGTHDRVLFDEDALAIARVAAGFMRHGIEPRHLRMYRAFAEREAALFEQVLLPYRRQRNPEAQARTGEALGELAGLGRRLRTVMLRQAVRRGLGG